MNGKHGAPAAAQACRGNNEKNEFLAIFESLPDPVFIVDHEMRIVRINQAGMRLIRSEARAERLFNEDGTWDIQFPWFSDELNLFLGTLDTVSGFQTWLDTGAGRRYFQVRFKRMTSLGGTFPGVIITLYDTTATQQHSEILQRFSMLYENTRDIMFFADEQGSIFEVNQAAIARYGYSRDEMLSLSIRNLLAPDDRNPDIAVIFGASVCNPLHESFHACKDGTHFPVEVSCSEETVGDVHIFLYIVRDISTRKRIETALKQRSEALAQALSELKEAHARVIQQEKLASIGQLAAGVAHEINNPVGYITSNLNSLRKYADKLATFIDAMSKTIERHVDAAARSDLEELKKQARIDYVMKDFRNLISESMEGADRVRKIVQDLKSFSRADSDRAVPSDLNECIRSTANVVRNEIKYVADLDLRLGDVPPVVCHPQQIGQVVMNLLVNAAHAIEQKGTITVATRREGPWAKIVVADTGKGIPPEIMKRIFEPFFTTKEVGKGTGLGLAISLDIIKKHGGDIAVESEPGKGSTFTVRLPIDGEIR